VKTFSKKPGDGPTRTVSCPLCGSWDAAPAWASRRIRKRENGNAGENVVFFSCRSCGFEYLRSQPETRVLLDRYDDEYFEYERANEERFFSLMRLGLLDIGFFDIEQDLLARSFRFLDIGCATGRLLEFLRERGFDVEGVEICRASAEYGRRARGLSISTRPLEETGYAALSFGVVHCSHLIEHLQDPVGFVREVRRILVPGGYFICATPNIGGFQARLMGPGWRSAIHDHMGLFSKRTLTALLEREGFQPRALRTWGGIAEGLGPRPVKWILDRAAKWFGFGDVMIVLALKPS